MNAKSDKPNWLYLASRLFNEKLYGLDKTRKFTMKYEGISRTIHGLFLIKSFNHSKFANEVSVVFTLIISAP
jgi:hypothetical protein